MDKELHYLTYDPDAIWEQMQEAYIAAGGDILYPGDEKDILLRGMQYMMSIFFAGVDNALKMDTLRYAVGEYLDIYGEKRNCVRIPAQAARCRVEMTFAAGAGVTVPAGTAMTADGEIIYVTVNDVYQNPYSNTAQADIICTETGAQGNGLNAGTAMLLLNQDANILSITTMQEARGGQAKEDDEAYRERIRQYGLASVTTGTYTAYRSAAMEVSSEIIDANPVNGGAGVVNVYLLINEGTPVQGIINAVTAKLSPKDVRPLTDTVNVAQATDVEYTLNVQYVSDAGGDISAEVGAAILEYQKWQDETIGRAFDPDKLKAMLYQAGASRVTFAAGSEFDGGDVEYTEIEASERCKGEITAAVVSA